MQLIGPGLILEEPVIQKPNKYVPIQSVTVNNKAAQRLTPVLDVLEDQRSQDEDMISQSIRTVETMSAPLDFKVRRSSQFV